MAETDQTFDEIGLPLESFEETYKPEIKEKPKPSEPLIIINPKQAKLDSAEAITNKSADMEKIRKIPKPPASTFKHNSFDDFLEWVNLLTDDHWSHMMMYLYRTWPMIVRLGDNPDSPNYIDIITQKTGTMRGGILQYLKDTHGSGRYKIIVNDTDKRTAQSVCTAYCLIDLTKDCMPILNYSELVLDSKENMGYLNILRSQGLVDGKGNLMPASAMQTTSTVVDNEMAKEVLNLYKEGSKEDRQRIDKLITSVTGKKEDTGLTELFLEKLKQEDPNKQLTLVMAIVGAMKEMIPKQDNSAAQVQAQAQTNSLNHILEIQAKAHSESMGMMTKMVELATAKNSNNDDSFLDKLIKYKEVMPGLFGGGGNEGNPGKRSIAEIIADKVGDIVLPAIGLVSQIIQVKTGAAPIVPTNEQQANAMMQQQRSQTGGGDMKRDNVVQLPASQQNQQTNPNTNSTLNPNIEIPEEKRIILQLFQVYGGMLIGGIQSGMTGYEMAETLQSATPMFKQDVYLMFKNQGAERILQTMKEIPEIWNQTGVVYGEGHIVKLIGEFVSYEYDDGDGDEIEGAPELGA